MKKKLTIIDVAKEAGVSIATISRVLNDSPYVAKGTKKRIMSIMDEMGYVPNEFARGINMARSKSVVVLCPDVLDSYQTNILVSLVENAEIYQNNLHMLKSKNLFSELSLEKRIISLNPEAIIVLENTIEEISYLIERFPKINFIVFNQEETDKENVYTINASLTKIAKLAKTEKIVALKDQNNKYFNEVLVKIGVKLVSLEDLQKSNDHAGQKVLIVRSEDAVKLLEAKINNCEIISIKKEQSQELSLETYDFGIYAMAIISKLHKKDTVKKVTNI